MVFKNKNVGMMAFIAACPLIFASPADAFEFGAFGDVSYNSSDESGVADSFALGGLDLYAKQNIDTSTEAFIEYVFENDGEGFVLDLERLYLKRKLNDNMSISMGRFHSPLGYWNATFHHGVMIQDTVSRPSFLDFEDGEAAILPTHGIGIQLQGNAGAIGYELAIANSTFLDTTLSANAVDAGSAKEGLEIGIGNISDLSDDKTIFGRLTYDISDVKLGFSFMSNSIVEAAATGDSAFGGVTLGNELIDQQLLGLDVRYTYDRLGVLAEYFNIDNSAATGVGGDGTADAYYVQASYQVNDKFRPTVRYESLEFDATDAYFNILGTTAYTASVVALRYDLDDSNALTFEYKNTSPKSGTDVAEMTLDWSFLMF